MLFSVMYVFSAVFRLSLIGIALGAPCLAVIGVMFLWSVSMLLAFSIITSIGLNPQSFEILSFNAKVFLLPAIMRLSFSSVGHLKKSPCVEYFGFTHSIL